MAHQRLQLASVPDRRRAQIFSAARTTAAIRGDGAVE